MAQRGEGAKDKTFKVFETLKVCLLGKVELFVPGDFLLNCSFLTISPFLRCAGFATANLYGLSDSAKVARSVR